MSEQRGLLDKPPEYAATPRPGITEWSNPKNGFFVCRIHFSADPAKRSPEWKAKAQQGLSQRAFLREYEINWSSPEGEPVIAEFDASKHVVQTHITRDAKLLRFWDFGAVSPVVLFAQLSPYGQILVHRELCPFNTPLDQLVPVVTAISTDLVTRTDYFDAGDPEADSVGSLGAIGTALQRVGIHMHTNRPGHEQSYAQLRAKFLQSVYVPRSGHEPFILISPQCPNLIEALSGAFHLSALPPYRVNKAHPHKDLVDALRYGCDNIQAAGSDYQGTLKKLASGDRAW